MSVKSICKKYGLEFLRDPYQIAHGNLNCLVKKGDKILEITPEFVSAVSEYILEKHICSYFNIVMKERTTYCRTRTEKWLVRRRELIDKLKRQHRKYCATTGLSYHKDSREGKQN